jgi:formylglycine-generating enzyme required for sulfatase activity
VAGLALAVSGILACRAREAPVATPAPAIHDDRRCLGGLCKVPAGTFAMGCDVASDPECEPEEGPRHDVDVPAFAIDRLEVTVADWARCVEARGEGCTRPGTGGRCNWGRADRGAHPVNCVDWDQASAWCRWAGRRLCSEAEWERAARGSDGRRFAWGDATPTCDLAAMHADGAGYGCGADSTLPAGSRPAGAGPFGSLDLTGNVFEWVEDDWHASYAGAPADGAPWIERPRVPSRVFRGGAVDAGPRYLRATLRHNARPGDRFEYVGFRCCASR